MDISEHSVGPDLKKTLMLNFLQTLRILSLIPATYGMVSDGVPSFCFSSLSSDSSAGRAVPAGCVAGIVRGITKQMEDLKEEDHQWQFSG